MNIKSAKSMRNFCRTCMTKFSKAQRESAINNKQNINDIPVGCKDTSLMQLLQLVYPQIKVEINDNLPKLICSNCIKQLLMAHEFIEMYKNADKLFRNILKQIEAPNNIRPNVNPVQGSIEDIPINDQIEEEEVLEKEKVDDIYELTKLEVEKVNIEELEKEVLNVNDWPEFNDEPLDDISMEEECKEYFTNPYSDDEQEHEADKDLYFSNPYSDSGDEWAPNDSGEKKTFAKIINRKRKIKNKINNKTNKKISPKKPNSKKISNNKKKDDETPTQISLNKDETTTEISSKKTDSNSPSDNKKQDEDTQISPKNIDSKDDETTTQSSPKKIDNKDDETTTQSSPTKTDSNICNNKKQDEEKHVTPIENENGSFPCQKCDTVLHTEELLKEHMRFHQKGGIRGRNGRGFKCDICGNAYSQNTSYEIHMRIHTGDAPYLCIECGKSFKALSSLNTHMLWHKGEKNVQCPQCPKKFLTQSGLYGHMMVHTKEKKFVCDICGAAFHMAHMLRTHNLYHNGIKNYPCEHCDKRFVTAEKQRRHMRTHTGEKPYRCKYCEKAFAQSNDYIKHLKRHLGDNVYQCELCPLRFPMDRDLRVHFATHNEEDEETRARNIKAREEEIRQLDIRLGVKDAGK